MGPSFVRCVAVLTLVFFIGSMAACTTCRKLPIQTAADYQSIQIDPLKNYQIEFINGETWKGKGDRLIVSNDLIGIRYEGEQDYRYYRITQLKSICAEQFSTGKTVGIIVGGVAALGGIIAAAAILALGSAQK